MATQYTRTGNKDWVGAIKSRWRSAWGQGTDATNPMDYAVSNNFLEKARSAASTNDKPIWQVDTDDVLRLGGECLAPMAATINFPLATNASIVSQCFFIAPHAMEITAISCIFDVTDGATNTGYVTHESGTQAPGVGATVMNGTFNLNATARTVQNATLWVEFPSAVGSTQTAKYSQVIRMASGDRLSFKIASAVTSLAGLVISVAATPGGKGVIATWSMQANGDLADGYMFTANRDFIVTAAYYVHSTLCSVASSALMLKRATSTNTPANGTALLTNNTNIGFAATGAINTVQTGALTATAASLRLAPGDRLALDFTATLTLLAGVVVVVVLQPILARKEITFALDKTANMIDQAFYVADRNYEIADASAVWSVLSSGGANVKLTRDTGTTAAGGGTNLLSNDTSAGFQIDGTANVPERATWVNTQFNYLMAGDRLSVKWASAPTALRSFCLTVSLIPR